MPHRIDITCTGNKNGKKKKKTKNDSVVISPDSDILPILETEKQSLPTNKHTIHSTMDSDSAFRAALTQCKDKDPIHEDDHQEPESDPLLPCGTTRTVDNNNNSNNNRPKKQTREIREMASDGNCLFRSLSDQLYNDYGKNHEKVRCDICDYLQNHKEDFAVFLLLEEENPSNTKKKNSSHWGGKKSSQVSRKNQKQVQSKKAHVKEKESSDTDVCDFEQYVETMRQYGQWGGQVELVCAARLYRRRITIFSAIGAYHIDSMDYSHSHDTDKIKADLDCNPTQDILLSYHENSHYNSVRDSTLYMNEHDHVEDDPTNHDSLPHSQDIAISLDKNTVENHQNQKETTEQVTSQQGNIGKGSDPSTMPHIRYEKKSVTRNESCPCGSGLRYKKCCLVKEKNQAKLAAFRKKHGLPNSLDQLPSQCTKDDSNTHPIQELEGGFRVFNL